MAAESLEQVYEGLKDYIQEYLTDILEESDIDDIKTPMFKQILRTSTIDILGLKQYPTLMMEYGRVTVERETTNSDRYSIPLSLYCFSSGSDKDKMQKKSERYVWAIKKMLERDYTLDSLVDMTDVVGYDFSPAIPKQQVFIHFGVIYITLDILISRK